MNRETRTGPCPEEERNVESKIGSKEPKNRLKFNSEKVSKVVLELKSTETVPLIHEAQLLTYLRLMNKQVGLLINFNEPVLTKGIRRCVLRANETILQV
jgi:GxxExxY protein